jgi:hypothetical protein
MMTHCVALERLPVGGRRLARGLLGPLDLLAELGRLGLELAWRLRVAVLVRVDILVLRDGVGTAVRVMN